MAIGRRGLGATGWQPSKPVRIAIAVAMLALLAGFAAYVVFAGEISMPYRLGSRHQYFRPIAHLHFKGADALLLAMGFAFVAAAVAVQIVRLIGAEPQQKVSSSLANALAWTGFVIIMGLFAAKFFNLI